MINLWPRLTAPSVLLPKLAVKRLRRLLPVALLGLAGMLSASTASAELRQVWVYDSGDAPFFSENIFSPTGQVLTYPIRERSFLSLETLWNSLARHTIEVTSADPSVVQPGSRNCGVGGQVSYCSVQLIARTAGSTSLTLRAFDANGGLTDTYVFTMNVTASLPAAPRIGLATAGDGQARVAFTAPTFTGGTPILGYEVIPVPAGTPVTGNSSPILVPNLVNGTPYSFTVRAINAVGTGPSSAPSNSVTPLALPIARDLQAAVAYGGSTRLEDLAAAGETVSITTPPEFGTATVAGTSIEYAARAGYAGPDPFFYALGNASGTSLPARVDIEVAAPAIVVTPASGALPDAGLRTPYAATFTASGGAAPYAFAITGGTLPPGLALSGSGELAGEPGAAGEFAFTVTATDASAGAAAPFSASSDYTLRVGRGGQSIDFGAQAAQRFVAGGQFALSPAASADSGLPVSYTSLTPDVCTISGETVTILAAGTCTIAADQPGDANFDPAPRVVQSIVIGRAAQSISAFIAAPAAPTFSPGGTFTVSATGGASGNPVVFSSNTPAVCSVAGETVSIRLAGACTLLAEQAGNENFEAAPVATLTVAIAAATPTLAWIDGLQRDVGEADFELPLPQSNSPGEFTFSSSDPSVAIIDGTTVSLVGPGTTTLVATQAAASNYTAASISTTLTVSDRPDPSRDPGVAGVLQAQADASQRFATTQQANILDRLRQVRAADGMNASSSQLQLTAGTGTDAGGIALPLRDGNGNQDASGWGLWTAGTLSFGERDDRAASSGFEVRSDGLSLGIDRRFGERALMGLAGGLGWGDADLSDGRSSVDADQRSLAAYGLWRQGERLFVDAVLGWGWLDFEIARWSDPAGATASATRGGEQRFASIGLGYEQGVGAGAILTGYGRLETSRTTLEAYRETGLGPYDLAYREQDIDARALALGIEGRHPLAWRARPIQAFWSVGYRDALHERGDAAINYVIQPVARDYTLGLRSLNEDVLALGLGFDLAWSSNWQMSFQYQREQASGAHSDGFALRLVYTGGGPAVGSALQPQR